MATTALTSTGPVPTAAGGAAQDTNRRATGGAMPRASAFVQVPSFNRRRKCGFFTLLRSREAGHSVASVARSWTPRSSGEARDTHPRHNIGHARLLGSLLATVSHPRFLHAVPLSQALRVALVCSNARRVRSSPTCGRATDRAWCCPTPRRRSRWRSAGPGGPLARGTGVRHHCWLWLTRTGT